jgi:hypothetical protein
MTKDEAITLHIKYWEKFPVFVWVEGNDYITEVDGKVFKSSNEFGLDSKLSVAGIPAPRNLYLIDAPDYEEKRNDSI